MSDNTGIEWTDATWNPIVGCSIVSPGCTNCYAMKMANRIRHAAGDKSHYSGTTKVVNSKPVWTGKLALAPEAIFSQPMRWQKPRRIFVNSMGDLFHESATLGWIDTVFAVMAYSPQHQFQVLTKRSKVMWAYMNESNVTDRIGEAMSDIDPESREALNWPLPNLWLGVSVEDQERADERIDDLLSTPAVVRFISAEPLLGPIELRRCGGDKRDMNALTGYDNQVATLGGPGPRLDWVICGGESGAGARPMSREWARSLRDQCVAAGTPFFFKQWGEFAPDDPASAHTSMRRVGKIRAGRILDGMEHNGLPA